MSEFKPDQTHPDYDTMLEVWKMCRDCNTGQRAIHKAGETYLPALSGQNDTEYKNYLKRTVFMNATGRTIDGMAGMVFRKYPAIMLPEALKPYEEDIDMGGVSLYGFAHSLVKDVITVGRSGIMVDHPKTGTNENGVYPTVAESVALGNRPYLVRYDAEKIRYWRYGRVNHATVLTQVLLEEPDELDSKKIQIRELHLDGGVYGQRIWRMDSSAKWIASDDHMPTMNGQFIKQIPFWFAQPEEGRGAVQDPPIEDLANVNLAHYRNSADYENALHVAGQPTPWVSGISDGIDENGKAKPQTLHLGSNSFIRLHKDGQAGFLQIGSEGLAGLEKAMQTKEMQMAALGARMLAPEKREAEAADAIGMKRAGENSVLATMAGSVDMSLTQALRFMAMWVGADPDEASIDLNKIYMTARMDSSMLREWLAALQGGKISYETFWRGLQQGDLVPENVTAEDELEKISEAGPSFGDIGDDR